MTPCERKHGLRLRDAAVALAAVCALGACSATGPVQPPPAGVLQADAAACIVALRGATSSPGTGLATDGIRLVNWNVEKGRHRDWSRDYARLTGDSDLVLIQEASLRADTVDDLPPALHWSFAPGYRRRGQVTGVLTLSAARPMTQCKLAATEPLLRTPKATSITQFALLGSDATLIVVNVHAINFSFGLGMYERQFDAIADVLEQHSGPIILGGDFNTWRDARMRVVDALAQRIALEPLQFDVDHRMRFMGKALDHIFVRGLYALDSKTYEVTSSDHNPMSVTLAM